MVHAALLPVMILIFEYAKSATHLPGFTDRQPEAGVSYYSIENTLFAVGFRFLFFAAQLCQGFSPPKTFLQCSLGVSSPPCSFLLS
jgi:hypothetical protein